MYSPNLSALEIPFAPLPPYDYRMSIELIIAGILGVFLLVYLVYSIVRPDRF